MLRTLLLIPRVELVGAPSRGLSHEHAAVVAGVSQERDELAAPWWRTAHRTRTSLCVDLGRDEAGVLGQGR